MVRAKSRLVLVPVLALAACAATEGAPSAPPPEPALYRADTAAARPVAEPFVGRPAPTRTVDLVELAFRIVRADGTVVTAPRVTLYPGQRGNLSIMDRTAFIGDFDVDTAQDAAIGDPVIDVITEGVVADVVARFVDGDPSQIALAFSISSSELRRPIRTLDVAPLARGGSAVTIQLPATETLEVRGARRVTDGRETEIARLPSGNDVVTVRCRASRSQWTEEVRAPSDPAAPSAGPQDAADPEMPTGAANSPGDVLVRLARLAAEGAPAKHLRAEAVRSRVAPGADEVLGRLSATTVLAEGVRLSSHLDERYLAGYDLAAAATPVADPRISSQVSGLWIDVQGDGSCRARWTVTPRFEARRLQAADLERGLIADAALPELAVEVPNVWSESLTLVPGPEWAASGAAPAGGERLFVRVSAGAAE